jgi:hypothetical protein
MMTKRVETTTHSPRTKPEEKKSAKPPFGDKKKPAFGKSNKTKPEKE